MKKSVNCPETEPESVMFENPSEGEHSFQVVDLFESKDDPDIVSVKLEVCSENEHGRSILHRLNLDDTFKGFFATRLFLKAIKEPHKGVVEIDTDNWIGKSFVATIVHNKSEKNGKTYANLKEYNFDIEASIFTSKDEPKESDDIAWKD